MDASTTLVIFGGTGDLAARLIYPALFRLEELDHLDGISIVAAGLEPWGEAELLEHLARSLPEGADEATRSRFLARFGYHSGDLTPEAMAPLADRMGDVAIHYLALPPGLFATAAGAIATSGLTDRGTHRLVVEKPFGTDGASAASLEAELHRHWSEDQIFRIDHFLGKETVQNLSVVRFANRVVEPLLSSVNVDQVQITVAETLGVEGRYRYYDGIGALRDMIQNHLMQLFCLAAMDPPAVWDAEVLRDHKVEVLRAVRRPSGPVERWAARGRYASGAGMPAYVDEHGIPDDSTTETFAAVRLEVDNWRWQGVPFYLRSGKRQGAKLSEIAYRFRPPPTRLFEQTSLDGGEPNWLVFRLDQPEGIDLFIQTRAPGLELVAETGHLHTDYGDGSERTTAYEQLLLDVIEGDHTPFLRADEIEWAWRILDPVLDAWEVGVPTPYPAGSDGPSSQDSILLPGHRWRTLPTAG
jgi:glucose-6-phosphate 1-dehydrogenase